MFICIWYVTCFLIFSTVSCLFFIDFLVVFFSLIFLFIDFTVGCFSFDIVVFFSLISYMILQLGVFYLVLWCFFP